MKNTKVYNVNCYFEELEKAAKNGDRYYTFHDPHRWNEDFIIFYKNGGMTFYQMRETLHGYTRRNYNKVPQKYIEYKVNSRIPA